MDSCYINLMNNKETGLIFVNSNEYDKVVIKMDDLSGSIVFNGYWYTKNFQEYLSNKEEYMWKSEARGIEYDDTISFTEEFETPKEILLKYSTKTENFSILADVYKRDVFEETSSIFNATHPPEDSNPTSATAPVGLKPLETSKYGPADYDDVSEFICLTPTYMNRLWFRVKK